MSLNAGRRAMEARGCSEASIRRFEDAYKKWQSCESETVDLAQFSSIQNDDILDFESTQRTQADEQRLESLVVLKLNGGLGTSMGCQGPKSLIPVRNETSFLDYIIQSQEAMSLDLTLLNSFYTNEDTQGYLAKHGSKVQIQSLVQDQFPRIDIDTGAPVPDLDTTDSGWSPPGHGNIYSVLKESGTLDTWIQAGKEWVFISNSDNIAAQVDLGILNTLANSDTRFLMEVTPKTSADKKGGILVRDADGRIQLVEIADVDPKDHEQFQDTNRFSYFNTNNLWVHLPTLKSLVESDSLTMRWIFNHKTVQGYSVLQFEQAMGTAIQCFPNAKLLNVPRSRFMPVKRCQDLCVLASDCFEEKGSGLVATVSSFPELQLSSDYQNINDYHTLIPYPLGLKNASSLRIDGAFQFGENVDILGSVHLENSDNTPKIIPDNSQLSNENWKELIND